MTGSDPPALKWGKDPGADGERRRKESFQRKKPTSSCVCWTSPFFRMIGFSAGIRSTEDSSLFLRPTFSEPHLQRTSRRGGCVAPARSAVWGGRGHSRPRHSSSITFKAKAGATGFPAVAWMVVFIILLNSSSMWKLCSASGGHASSSRLHFPTGQKTIHDRRVLTALPPLLHRQEAITRASENQQESKTAAGVSVSAGTPDGRWLHSAAASPHAHSTTATDASTPVAGATPVATAAALRTTTAAGAPPVTKATTVVPALLTLKAAAPRRAASAARPAVAEGAFWTAAEAGEASVNGTDQAAYAVTDKVAKQAETLRAATPVEAGGGAAIMAATRSHQTVAGRAWPEEGGGGDTPGAGEQAQAAGEEDKAAAAKTKELDASAAGPTGAERVRSSGGRVHGNTWRYKGRVSLLSLTGHSKGLSATLDEATHNVTESSAAESATPEAADEPTPEAEDRRKLEAAAEAAAPGAAGRASRAAEAGEKQPGGRTAAWRAAAAAQKKTLEDERRAARNAAQKPSPAEVESAQRKQAAAAETSREAAVRRQEESTGGSDALTESCAAVVQPMVERGMSEAATEKIKRMLTVERFVEKVSELRRIAARKCLAGEEDACETPEKPAWQAAGLSKPPDAPTIKRFTLPASLCAASRTGSSSIPQRSREAAQLDSNERASKGNNLKQVRGGSTGETTTHTDMMELQGNDRSDAAGGTSLMAQYHVEIHGGNGRVDGEMQAQDGNDTRSAFPLAQTTGEKEEKFRKRCDSDTAADCTVSRTTHGTFVETPASKGAHIDRPLSATHPEGNRSSGESREGKSGRREGSKSRGNGSSSDGESSSQQTSGHSTGTPAMGDSRSRGGSDNTEEDRWRGRTFSGSEESTRYGEGGDEATADEEEVWKEPLLKNPPVWRKRRNFHKSRRAPPQLRILPEDGPRVRPVALVQARLRGIFNALQSLFGNGMDISNPQNFDGGNQGSFFNFMYPADTDYPWACVCDENQWKRWQEKEIEAVPCRNQVDTSAQGITAACNPLNHQMNLAPPSNAHDNAIILGLLSAAFVLVSSAA